MRKWRPTHKCIYVIPEVHGSYKSLEIIFNRILPLRFSVNQEDTVVLLGDYIDKGTDSATVLEALVTYKKIYGDSFICLKGNHEHLMLRALESESNYKDWIMQGGVATINSYLLKMGLDSNPATFPFSRLKDIIPNEHIDFINDMPSHIEIDDYVLFHGGVNISDPSNTTDITYMFDMSASLSVKKSLKDKKNICINTNKVYVGSHNYKSKLPFVSSKYFMLGGSAPQNLILFELNSMSCAMIKDSKSRIYKHNFKVFE